MSFYSGLRDDTAGPLIAQFGQSGSYRTFKSESYDTVTGKTTPGSASDLTIRLLELPVRNIGSTAAQRFSEEVAAKMEAVLLVSAKEFASAKVEPKVDQKVVYAGKVVTILAIKPLAPSGEPVIYTMAVK